MATIDVKDFRFPRIKSKSKNVSRTHTPRASNIPRDIECKSKTFEEDPDMSGTASECFPWLSVGSSSSKIRLSIDRTNFHIDKSGSFLVDIEKHAAKSQLFNLVIKELVEDCKNPHFLKSESSENLISHTWGNIVKLFEMIRMHVLIRDKVKGFTLAVSKRNFLDEELVKTAAEFLDTKFVKKILSPELHLEMLQNVKGGQKSRSTIAQRYKSLCKDKDLFCSLAAVMQRAIDGSMGRAAAGKVVNRRSKGSRRNSLSRAERSKDSKEIGMLLRNFEKAYENQEKFITTLVLLGYGDAFQLRATLKICMQSIKELKKAEISMRQHQFQEGKGILMMSAGSSLVLHVLSQQHADEVVEQMITKRAKLVGHASIDDHSLKLHRYIVKLSGIPVNAEELGKGRLQGLKKSRMLLHQQVSSSEFIQALFGICHSPSIGWISISELVYFTLASVLEGTVLEFSANNSGKSRVSSCRSGSERKELRTHVGNDNRSIRRREHLSERLQIKISVGIALGLTALHSADSFHGNLRPSAVGLNSSFGVKLLDFGASPKLPGVKSLDSSYYPPEFYLSKNVEAFSKSEAMRRADVYSCGAIVSEMFSSERRRLRNWMPVDIVGEFKKILKSQSRSNPIQAPAFNVGNILEPQRPELAGFLTHCISINPEHRPEIKKLSLAFKNIQKDIMRTLGDQVVYLDTLESQDVDSQLVHTNKLKSTPNNYKVYLTGLPVCAIVLGSREMKENLLQGVKRSMILSAHNSFLDFFGCAYSERHGWLVVTEMIEETLPNVMESKVPDLKQRLSMALQLIDGLGEFHKAYLEKPYKLLPTKIHIASDYNVKLDLLFPIIIKETEEVTNFGSMKILMPPELLNPEHLSSDSSASEARTPRLYDQKIGDESKWTLYSDIFMLGSILLEWLNEYQDADAFRVTPADGSAVNSLTNFKSHKELARSRANSSTIPGSKNCTNFNEVGSGIGAGLGSTTSLPAPHTGPLSQSGKDNLKKIQVQRKQKDAKLIAAKSEPNLMREGESQTEKRENLKLETQSQKASITAMTYQKDVKKINENKFASRDVGISENIHSSRPYAQLGSANNLLAVPRARESSAPVDLAEVLNRCLDSNQFRRPSIEEIREAVVTELTDETASENKMERSLQIPSVYEKSSRRPTSPRSKSKSYYPPSNFPSRHSLHSTPISVNERKSKRKIMIRSNHGSAPEIDSPVLLSRPDSGRHSGGDERPNGKPPRRPTLTNMEGNDRGENMGATRLHRAVHQHEHIISSGFRHSIHGSTSDLNPRLSTSSTGKSGRSSPQNHSPGRPLPKLNNDRQGHDSSKRSLRLRGRTRVRSADLAGGVEQFLNFLKDSGSRQSSAEPRSSTGSYAESKKSSPKSEMGSNAGANLFLKAKRGSGVVSKRASTASSGLPEGRIGDRNSRRRESPIIPRKNMLRAAVGSNDGKRRSNSAMIGASSSLLLRSGSARSLEAEDSASLLKASNEAIRNYKNSTSDLTASKYEQNDLHS